MLSHVSVVSEILSPAVIMTWKVLITIIVADYNLEVMYKHMKKTNPEIV